ncbi:MAG: CDP-glucose 4,6-dehydratase [Bdellovibrionales bacterium]|nr:CDP-glucose 4,6-dehydratase [Bdellovibrionales bacterium]
MTAKMTAGAGKIDLENAFRGKKVFLTGHTGFKGSWMALWLQGLGANVTGYALAAPSKPSHFELLRERGILKIESVIGDICDYQSLRDAMFACDPDLIIHMAAQPIVLKSYRDPIETYETNVMGTLKVFEAARALNEKRKKEAVRSLSILNITSDKCYENKETLVGYKESDPMGGYDPYSSSKGCAEILFSSYQRSYFPVAKFGGEKSDGHKVLMASVRAGNVIGGGDWAADRLIPDLIRGTAQGKITEIRNPSAIRPWQHVLEPLSGYLLVAAKLLNGDAKAATGFNFGPDEESCVTVGEILSSISKKWDGIKFQVDPLASQSSPHEAHFLKLDSTKARTELSWKPVLNFDETISWTADWYRTHQESKELLTLKQIAEFQKRMLG